MTTTLLNLIHLFSGCLVDVYANWSGELLYEGCMSEIPQELINQTILKIEVNAITTFHMDITVIAPMDTSTIQCIPQP